MLLHYNSISSLLQAISLPVGGDRGPVTYSFGLSANEDGGPNKQGSTACLRSTNNTLESVGTMGETLRVKASEDVYKRIGQRFNEVKLENDKKTTVLLDNKDKRKASVPKPNVIRKPVTQSLAPQPNARDRTVTTSAIPSSYSGLGPGRGAHQPPPRSHSPGGPVRPGGGVGPPGNGRPVNSPAHQVAKPEGVGDSKRVEKPPPPAHKTNKPPTTNPEIMKRTLRERLLHLLAVRTYKKPELIVRIQRDGIKEKDRKNITITLREVSECKNNVHELKRTMWNDIHEDWPFYTESDRMAIKRRKPQNLTPPGSDTGSTSSGHSPSSTNPASPPQITNPLKRHGFYDPPAGSDTAPSPKKKRVSSYKRPGSDNWSKSPGLTSGVSPRLPGLDPGHHSVSPRLDLTFDNVQDDSAPDWGQFHDGEPETRHRSPGRVQSGSRARSPEPSVVCKGATGASPQAQAKEVARDTEHEQVARDAEHEEELEQSHTTQHTQLMQLLQNQNKDFLENYIPIENSEQRNRYKAEFNQYYAKYRGLHNVLDSVSKKFASLENRLRETPKGTKEFQDVKEQIVGEYQRNKDDQTYQEARNSFQYLHEKLAHIKKLVHDFDTSNLAR
jgi:RNA polymerase II elongation factor ELL